MEPQEKTNLHQNLINLLLDAQRKAEENKFNDALNAIKEVKNQDPKNIYIVAIEKQIAKLSDDTTSEDNKKSVIQSLPAMIERAISDLQRRPITPKVEDVQKEQKEAALDKLKKQYFQRADDYVSKHDYPHALEEIRRIYIIEPNSVVAKEYEKKIEQLADLYAKNLAQPEKEETKEASKQIQDTSKIAEQVSYIEDKPKSKTPIIVAIAAIIILAIVAIIIFGKSSDSIASTETVNTEVKQDKPVVTEQTQVAAQQTNNKQNNAAEKKPVKEDIKTVKEEKKAEPKKEAKQEITTVTAPKQPEKKQVQQQQPKPQTQNVSQVQAPPPVAPKVEEPSAPIVPFVATEQPARVIKNAAAVYPPIAKKMRLKGTVEVEVTIDSQGKPTQAKIISSTNEVFDDAAIEAALKATYSPAMMSNGPISSTMVRSFKFDMK